jgi:hypothetical protein
MREMSESSKVRPIFPKSNFLEVSFCSLRQVVEWRMKAIQRPLRTPRRI